MVALDATMLMLFLRPDSAIPPDDSGRAVEFAAERVQHLIETLDKASIGVIIPTPALSEVLVRAGERHDQELVQQLLKWSCIRIVPFDVRAAIEVASMAREDLARTAKRSPRAETYAKLKYDRQIVAIAKVLRVTTIYSDDGGVRTLGSRVGIEVKGVGDLALPPSTSQRELELEKSTNKS